MKEKEVEEEEEAEKEEKMKKQNQFSELASGIKPIIFCALSIIPIALLLLFFKINKFLVRF